MAELPGLSRGTGTHQEGSEPRQAAPVLRELRHCAQRSQDTRNAILHTSLCSKGAASSPETPARTCGLAREARPGHPAIERTMAQVVCRFVKPRVPVGLGAACLTPHCHVSHAPALAPSLPGRLADAGFPADFLRHAGSKRMSVRTELWLVDKEWCRHPKIMPWPGQIQSARPGDTPRRRSAGPCRRSTQNLLPKFI